MGRHKGWLLVGLLIGCGDDEGTTSGSGGAGASPSTSSASGQSGTGQGAAGQGGTGQGGTGATTGPGAGGDAGQGGSGGDGPALEDGVACDAHDACASGLCLLEEATGYPGGMCASPCVDDPASCDGLCRSTPAGAACFPNCLGDPSVCREGLACRKVDPLTYVCEPACEADEDCVATGVCHGNGGRWVAPEQSCEDLLDDNGDDRVDCADPSCEGTAVCQVGATPLGGPCERHSDCASPTGHPMCLSEALAGAPAGVCVQFCSTQVDGFGAADCVVEGSCRSTLTFGERPGGSDPIGYCPFASCDAGTPCREGYGCCEQGQGCAAPSCVVGCTDDAQCVDTGHACVAPQPGWPIVCTPPPLEEICDNGVEDDDDYGSDCVDPDCAAFCADLAADLCAGAPALGPTQEGETVPGPGIGRACIYPDARGEVSPQVFAHVATATGTLRLSLSSVFPQVLGVVSGCELQTDQPIACDRDDDFDGSVEIEAEVEAGLTYHVLVWPAAPGHEDAFTLTAELP